MKHIKDYLYVSEGAQDTKVNIVVLDCGAMGDKKDDIKELIKVHETAHLWTTLYAMRNGKIQKIQGFEDIKFAGPHTDTDVLDKFIKQNAGTLTVYMGI